MVKNALNKFMPTLIEKIKESDGTKKGLNFLYESINSDDGILDLVLIKIMRQMVYNIAQKNRGIKVNDVSLEEIVRGKGGYQNYIYTKILEDKQYAEDLATVVTPIALRISIESIFPDFDNIDNVIFAFIKFSNSWG